jgi:hypothetical protein
MGRNAQVEVRIEKCERSVNGLMSLILRDRHKVKIHALWIVLVNGRRVDSFLKRRNAVAKARRLRCNISSSASKPTDRIDVNYPYSHKTIYPNLDDPDRADEIKHDRREAIERYSS